MRIEDRAEKVVIEWTTDRFQEKMDEDDCQELQGLIEKEIKDAIAEERRRCAAWAHAYEQDDDPAVSAGDTAYRIRRWIEDGTPEPR